MKKKFFVVLIMIMLVLFTGCSFGKKTEENKDVSVRYDGDDIIYKTKVNENTNMVKVYVNLDQAALLLLCLLLRLPLLQAVRLHH